MFRRRSSLARFAALTLICAGFALSGTSAASAEPAGPTADIINGTAVPDNPANWPYIAALLTSSNGLSQYCGGTLIAANWVLTAAHCIDAFGPPSPTHVLIGRKLLSGVGGETLAVQQTFVHPDYTGDASEGNDIALVKLSSSSAATTATMAAPADDPPNGASVGIAGWGNTSQTGDVFPDELRETTVEVVGNTACNTAYGGGVIFSSNLCAAHFEGVNDSLSRDTCQGDSGGPLVYNGKLAGVTSWGIGCAESPFPGVYTRVSSFAGWIAATMSGVDPQLSATSLDFGDVNLAGGESVRTLTLTAAGTASVSVSSVLSSSGEFAIRSDACTGATLPGGSSCDVQIAFTPAAAGTRGGIISFGTNAGAPVKTNVFGRGVSSAATPPPASTGVVLSVGQVRKAKRAGKKIAATFKVSFPVPAGQLPPAVCLGTMHLSVKAPGARKVSRSGNVITSADGTCKGTFSIKLAKKAKRKTATVSASFSGNDRLPAASVATRLKIK